MQTVAPGAAHHNELATLRGLVDARFWGLTYVVRHAAPRMAQGSIAVTSGSLSSRPRPGTAMLTAMRSAVEALAPELGPMRVNAVTPGLMNTPLLHTAYGAERDSIVQSWAAILPERGMGTADEVAQVILMSMANGMRLVKWGTWMGRVLRVTRHERFRLSFRMLREWRRGGAWAHVREPARRRLEPLIQGMPVSQRGRSVAARYGGGKRKGSPRTRRGL